MNRINILVFTILLFGNVSCKKQISEFAKVEGGIVKGAYINDLFVFKGVPFAALPVGELCWKAPQPF